MAAAVGLSPAATVAGMARYGIRTGKDAVRELEAERTLMRLMKKSR